MPASEYAYLNINVKYLTQIFKFTQYIPCSKRETVFNCCFLIQACISKMESRKFLPLMYQLAARMGSRSSGENLQFNENLEQVDITNFSSSVKGPGGALNKI